MSYKDALSAMRTRMIRPVIKQEDQTEALVKTGNSWQQDRMIQDKRRTLEKAVLYSYQAATIKKNEKEIKSLINPNKLKPDYDEKILSVGYEHNLSVGDVFEWVGTNTHWLIYLQDLTELAYFRGNIRKCSYKISWKDGYTYAAIIGPKETSLNTSMKHSLVIDSPNYSIHLLLPNTQENVNKFQRYTEFYLQNDKTCWRVEATDKYSTPGILEVYAKEYFANEDEDDLDKGIVGGRIEPVIDPNLTKDIKGETFIKPKMSYEYSVDSTFLPGKWVCESEHFPVEINEKDNVAVIKWISSYSGQFNLIFKNEIATLKKTIIVQSLF